MSCFDAVWITFAVTLVSFVSEGVSYFLLYRKKRFKNANKEVEVMAVKLEEAKKRDKEAHSKNTKQVVNQLDMRLKILTRDLTILQFPMNFVLALLFVSVYGFLNTVFDTFPVAKLPFHPFPLLQNLSHRNLPGDDDTDCAMAFILLLASMSLRTNIKKYLGFAPKTSYNMWMPNMDDWDEEPQVESPVATRASAQGSYF